jgi:hypothetical protein
MAAGKVIRNRCGKLVPKYAPSTAAARIKDTGGNPSEETGAVSVKTPRPPLTGRPCALRVIDVVASWAIQGDRVPVATSTS